MKHQDYYTRALKAADPRYARIFERMGYSTTALQAGEGTVTPPGPDIAALRAEYEKVFGKKPFNGWNAQALSEKIAEKRAAG